ncbi:SDR family NAD(P)-dependent oxidoreductase [Halobacterium jilantaiense]|uniref:Polysaccharide biosynthesis protein n=1 Tax=Halobacterium jilantaiense TaxID=355548 RepID=A0A1I0MSW6_9EURY|nr:SDR family NAD(P)-dependent oxidoreductase [Halobacterium jilantaiense]SEV91748.1 Polysaccharide biosynthesis protein [Halobacterium jilantaiense]
MSETTNRSLAGNQVLVTGGCGSIGSKIVSKLLETEAETVRVLDTDEEALFALKQEHTDNRLRFLLGDIRDRNRLKMAIEDIDVVFHAAALKHVELNEYNPFETVQTNVQGTQNLIRAALEESVDSFVAVSTDKASNPASVMGATKLLSERLVTAANTYKGERNTSFACVRFGNVLGSSGSVIPVFMEQIEDGGPVTVTDPEMTRFIMPTEKAVELVFRAQERMRGGEVFVLKMPGIRVGTLADAMIAEYAPRAGYEPGEIEREIIGARPGERTHEKLISEDELQYARELEEMYVIFPQIDLPSYRQEDYEKEPPVDEEYTSENSNLLGESEIVELIEEMDTIATIGT